MVKSSARKLPSSTNIFLFLILIIGFIVRLWGINYYFPYLPWPEDPHWYGFHFYFLQTGDWNPHYAYKPHFYMYMLAFVYSIIFIFKPEWKMLEYCTPLFMLIGRIFGASMGALTILPLFILGRIAFSKKVGLISALFLCFSFPHVLKCHGHHMDTFMTFLVVLSYIFIYKGYLHGKVKDFILAGIFAGLATSTKYPAVLLVLSIFFANFFYVINNKRRRREIFLGKRVILAVIFMIFFFIAGSPFLILDYATTIYDASRVFTDVTKNSLFETQSSFHYYVADLLPQRMGIILPLFTLVAIGFLLYRRKQNGFLLLTFPLAYFIVISMSSKISSRYIVLLTPFFSLFAGYFFVEIIDRLNFKRKIWKILIGFILIITLMGESMARVVYRDWLYTRADTRMQAKEWIEENIQESSKIGVYWVYGPPTLGRVDGQLSAMKKLQRVSNFDELRRQLQELYLVYQSKRAKRKYHVTIVRWFPKDIFVDRSKCPDYLLFEDKRVQRIYKSRHRWIRYQTVIKNCQLLKTFSPYRNPREGDMFIANESIFRRIYPGSLIKLYKVNKASLIAALKNVE